MTASPQQPIAPTAADGVAEIARLIARAGLVEAVVLSVRVVFASFIPSIFWAFFLSTVTIGSILFLPLLPLTLPWMAYASRALYRQAMP